MKYGYARGFIKGQLNGNSIEEQLNAILAVYSDAEIVVESYSGAKQRDDFREGRPKVQPQGQGLFLQFPHSVEYSESYPHLALQRLVFQNLIANQQNQDVWRFSKKSGRKLYERIQENADDQKGISESPFGIVTVKTLKQDYHYGNM